MVGSTAAAPGENLNLFTRGTATITQDALGNTYQRLPLGLTPIQEKRTSVAAL